MGLAALVAAVVVAVYGRLVLVVGAVSGVDIALHFRRAQQRIDLAALVEGCIEAEPEIGRVAEIDAAGNLAAFDDSVAQLRSYFTALEKVAGTSGEEPAKAGGPREAGGARVPEQGAAS